MAKIQMSAIGITAISGKIGGSVFAFNKGGKYVRNWAKPTNPQTAKQTSYRALFGWVSKQFGQLSPSAVEAWRQWGIDNPKVDVFGESRPQSAFGAFVSANQNNLHSGLDYLEFPMEKVEPVELSVNSFDLDIVSANTNLKFDVKFEGTADALTNYSASVAFAIVPQGSNRSYGSVKNQFEFRVRKTFANSASTVSFDASDLAELQGAIQEGQKVIGQLHVHSADGKKSAPLTFETVVVDTGGAA